MTAFLETQRLIIETPSVNDIDNWTALYRESETMAYTPDIIQDWLNTDILHFKKHGFSMGSVYKKDSKVFVGRAGLVYLDYDDTQPDIEVGYVLHKAYWNQGYATELAKALIRWGFNHLNINKLVAVTRSENKRSQGVLEKSRMHYSKIMKFRDEDFLLYEIYRQNT